MVLASLTDIPGDWYSGPLSCLVRVTNNSTFAVGGELPSWVNELWWWRPPGSQQGPPCTQPGFTRVSVPRRPGLDATRNPPPTHLAMAYTRGFRSFGTNAV